MMGDATDDAKALLRADRKNYLVCGAFLPVVALFHCLVTRTLPVGLVVSQFAVGAIFGVIALSLGYRRMPSSILDSVAAVLAILGATVFVILSGGPDSPYFHVFAALPFLLAMFTPASLLPTLVGGAVTLGSVVVVDVLAGVPVRTIVLQLVGFVMLLGLALFGTRTYRRMVEAQRLAHQARLQALEQLAESERRRGDAARERAEVERLVMVGQLAAGVAHEVNNPLAYVKANLCFLEREVEDTQRPLDRDELRGVLAETQQGVLRIQQIVTDLKDFSRAGNGGDEARAVLEEAVLEATRLASVRLRERGEVSLALDPGLPAVRLEQRRVVQVLLNLLLNAADAVELADPTCLAHITVRAWQVEEGVRVEVDDNGPGIPQEVLSRLFEPFFTTKPPGRGTGLGLALCREYVSRAGGSLHAENRPGGGARFVLRLPAVGASAAALA
jgi:two-component system, NtrC family, sensor kinase